MDLTRRQFLTSSALATGALSLGYGHPGLLPSHPLRILILGGTGFLGPHLVRFALHRGHHVTVFNRGRTEPTMFTDLFSQVEKLVGDRADDLASLATGDYRRLEGTVVKVLLLVAGYFCLTVG